MKPTTERIYLSGPTPGLAPRCQVWGRHAGKLEKVRGKWRCEKHRKVRKPEKPR